MKGARQLRWYLAVSEMQEEPSIEDLWTAAPSSSRIFEPKQKERVPDVVGRYLRHAIGPGTVLASAVRLRMHGEIKLKRWYPFSAEQVICWERGMIWRAAVRMYGLSIRGGDAFLDGHGYSRWKLFGVVPIVDASGPDIDRSSAGRVNIESIWLPSVLCSDGVSWTTPDINHLHADFTAHNERAQIDYVVDERGALKSVCMPRWGNPNSASFGYVSCGGYVAEQGRFGGYSIPTRMRIGWHFGTERFDSEGEFLRLVIDDAVYR